jgi:hypothetical protein
MLQRKDSKEISIARLVLDTAKVWLIVHTDATTSLKPAEILG